MRARPGSCRAPSMNSRITGICGGGSLEDNRALHAALLRAGVDVITDLNPTTISLWCTFHTPVPQDVGELLAAARVDLPSRASRWISCGACCRCTPAALSGPRPRCSTWRLALAADRVHDRH